MSGPLQRHLDDRPVLRSGQRSPGQATSFVERPVTRRTTQPHRPEPARTEQSAPAVSLMDLLSSPLRLHRSVPGELNGFSGFGAAMNQLGYEAVSLGLLATRPREDRDMATTYLSSCWDHALKTPLRERETHAPVVLRFQPEGSLERDDDYEHDAPEGTPDYLAPLDPQSPVLVTHGGPCTMASVHAMRQALDLYPGPAVSEPCSLGLALHLSLEHFTGHTIKVYGPVQVMDRLEERGLYNRELQIEHLYDIWDDKFPDREQPDMNTALAADLDQYLKEAEIETSDMIRARLGLPGYATPARLWQPRALVRCLNHAEEQGLDPEQTAWTRRLIGAVTRLAGLNTEMEQVRERWPYVQALARYTVDGFLTPPYLLELSTTKQMNTNGYGELGEYLNEAHQYAAEVGSPEPPLLALPATSDSLTDVIRAIEIMHESRNIMGEVIDIFDAWEDKAEERRAGERIAEDPPNACAFNEQVK